MYPFTIVCNYNLHKRTFSVIVTILTPCGLQKLSVNVMFVLRYISNKKDKFVDNLKEAVSIPSVSEDIERRPDVVAMVKWAEKKMKSLGADVELCDIGFQVRFYCDF